MRKARRRVSVRWCDVNKGDRDNMVIRSRLVGREFRWKDPFMQGTFAATPPLESLKYVFHWIQTRRRRRGRKLDIKLLVLAFPPTSSNESCTSPCRMRTQHQAWLGNFFERSMEHEMPLMNGTTSRIPRSVRSGIRSG